MSRSSAAIVIPDGGVIAERRIALRLSRRQFAELVGCGYQHIWSIESAQRNASIEVLDKIAETLGCDISEITKDTP